MRWWNPFRLSPAKNLSSPQAINCHDIHIAYHDYFAVERLTGSFPPGSLTAIVGPNGGGKSTLLKAIKGTLSLAKGSFQYTRGFDPRYHIAYLPQNTHIDRSFPLLGIDIVAMGLCPKVGFFKRLNSYHKDQVASALEKVHILDEAYQPLHTLSGGQFQRLLFARLSLQNAPVILLDEPFAAIDAPTMDLLAQLLCDWQGKGHTIITVLHDLEIVREHFPSTLILAKQCIAWGKTSQVLTSDNIIQAKNSLCQRLNPKVVNAFSNIPTLSTNT